MTYHFLKFSILEDFFKNGKKQREKERGSCGLFGARNPKFSFASNSHQGFPEGCIGLHTQKDLGERLIVKSDFD